jgi:hypothetical protein
MELSASTAYSSLRINCSNNTAFTTFRAVSINAAFICSKTFIHNLITRLMVKLYELRIGNFFELKLAPTHARRTIKVSQITQDHVLLEGNWHHIDKLIPIPITEEILLKCGFEKFRWITEASVYKSGDFNCVLDENGLQVFGADFNNLKPLRYLHELQNLYSDLTEKELKVEFDEVTTWESERQVKKEKKYSLLRSNT